MFYRGLGIFARRQKVWLKEDRSFVLLASSTGCCPKLDHTKKKKLSLFAIRSITISVLPQASLQRVHASKYVQCTGHSRYTKSCINILYEGNDFFTGKNPLMKYTITAA